LVREPATAYDRPRNANEPHAAARYLHELVADACQEVMGALMLDGRHRAIGHHIAYRGTLNRAAVEPRGLLVPALLANAASYIVFHNHPSGDPTPSAEDLCFTRRLAEASELVGISLLDHIILGEKPRYVSLRERGAW
jgi:DNA repair protein RadC